MGMYTEFHFNSALKESTPIEIIEILDYMLNKRESVPHLPDHPLFETQKWETMLLTDSAYFDTITHSVLVAKEGIKTPAQYYLSIRCNTKNYDQEIEKFVDWIMPHLDKHVGQFLGFSRYEETEEPTLIFATDSTSILG